MSDTGKHSSPNVWVRLAPNHEGWFWMRWPHGEIEVIHVRRTSVGTLRVGAHGTVNELTDDLGAEWCGPLTPPV